MPPAKAIVIDPADNVATALVAIHADERVALKGSAPIRSLTVLDPIPPGHKFSLRPIGPGRPVTKYGESIGRTTAPIETGRHVHVHNVESRRGRGDRPEGAPP